MEETSKSGQLLASWWRMLTWLMGLALATVFLYMFGELAGDVRSGEGFAFDLPMMQALRHRASPWLTIAMWIITVSGSGPVAIGVAIGLGIHWWRKVGQRAEAIVLLVTLAGSAALGQTLKLLFARPRPQLLPWLTLAKGWSFPSGHTLTAVTLGGLLAWLIGQQLNRWRQTTLWAATGLWAGLVGLSRVYLGVHYPSDVLASLAVGGLCLLVAQYAYQSNVSQPAQ